MIRVRFTPALSDLFTERRIFLRYPETSVPPPNWLFFNHGCALEAYSHVFHGPILPLRIGAFSYAHSAIGPNTVVGRYCSIGLGVSWIGESHPLDRVSTHPMTYDDRPLPAVAAFCADHDLAPNLVPYPSGPLIVRVEHDVWIGQGAAIMPNLRIGVGAVVAASSLVVGDVEPYTIVGGVPAKVVRKRFSEETIASLLQSEWWRYHPKDILRMNMSNPESFLDALDDLKPDLSALPLPRLTSEEMIVAGAS